MRSQVDQSRGSHALWYALSLGALLSTVSAEAIRGPDIIFFSCADMIDACPGWVEGRDAFDRYLRGENDGTVFTAPILMHPGAAEAFRLSYFGHSNTCPDIDEQSVRLRRIRFGSPPECPIVPCEVPRPYAPVGFGSAPDVWRWIPRE